jgi:hypothetical protein
MDKPGDGGCVCEAVRYRVNANAQAELVCNYAWCHRRSGSAFAFLACFKEEDVVFLGARLTAYEHRSDETGP